MMDLKTIRSELGKLTEIVGAWQASEEIPALERDLALEKLRALYEAVRFGGRGRGAESAQAGPSADESAGESAESAESAAGVALDLGEVLSLDASALSSPDEPGVSATAFEDRTAAAESPAAGPFAADPAPDRELAPAAELVPDMAFAPAAEFVPDMEPAPDVEPVPVIEEPMPDAEFAPRSDMEPLPEPGSQKLEPAPELKPATGPEPTAEAVSAPQPEPPVESEPELAPQSAETLAQSESQPEPAPRPEPGSPESAPGTEPASGMEPASGTEPASAAKPRYVAPTLFGLEEETVRHRHKQRVIMSLYDTAPDEKPDRAERAAGPGQDNAFGHAAATGGAFRAEAAGTPDVRVSETSAPEPAQTPVRGAAEAAEAAEATEAAEAPQPRRSLRDPQTPARSDSSAESDAPVNGVPAGARAASGGAASDTAPVLGEVINHDVQTLADTLARPRDAASGLRRGEPVTDLRRAIGINDKFLLIRDLFGGDGAAYEAALDALDGCEDFDDCMIHIAENYAWNPNSDGAKLIMDLLERKFA